ncbi:MerR family transcriptional regulator [Lacinutrix iliipiscaria]|uniref:MerR family transcriptional regulator n=1 Tax=Lacinutrix iliipiscaria TaxID=1230532 RepID=A0ABW5WHT3_9FLAO
MSKYTMAQIVTLTGIKAHTLRKWESRYSFLEPHRTDTNIRYYSGEQLKKLLNISILNRNGYRISKIDNLSEGEIYDIITKQIIGTNIEDEISTLVLSTLELNEEKFDEIIKSQVLKKGLLSTTIDLIYPFLHQVGVLWGLNKVMPAQEHFISNLIKKRIFVAIDMLPAPKEDSPSIVMFLPEEEYHEIGLLLAYYIARELGWRVYYLGQNVPIENIKEVIDTTQPTALLSMFVTPSQVSFEQRVDEILEQSTTPLLVSGNPESIGEIINKERIIFLSHPNDFVKKLKLFS